MTDSEETPQGPIQPPLTEEQVEEEKSYSEIEDERAQAAENEVQKVQKSTSKTRASSS